MRNRHRSRLRKVSARELKHLLQQTFHDSRPMWELSSPWPVSCLRGNSAASPHLHPPGVRAAQPRSPLRTTRAMVHPTLRRRLLLLCSWFLYFRTGMFLSGGGAYPIPLETVYQCVPPLLPEAWNALSLCIRCSHSFPSIAFSLDAKGPEGLLSIPRRSHQCSKVIDPRKAVGASFK